MAVPTVYREFTTPRVLTMSFEKGIPATSVQKMHEQGIDLKKCARVISETFTHMIFKEGFVHSDPHPGNIFVRPKAQADGTQDVEIVLLDHGIYTELSDEVRHAYTKLWRGMLTQNEPKIKEASKELGADFFELFAAMISGRQYEDVMDTENAYRMKTRLGEKHDEESRKKRKEFAMANNQQIVDILDSLRRELLLVLKTNNYLRAIDKRLGNPNNTYNTINNTTWEVYCGEMATLSHWDHYKELGQYFILRFLFALHLWKIRI